MKKSAMFLFSIVLLLGIFSAVYGQEETDGTIVGESSEIEISENEQPTEFEEGVELGETGGITPDSALYFFDEFLDRFGNDVSLREEKVAEIKAMIQAGKIEDAKVALERYKGYANNLEREVSPEQRD